MSQRSHAKAMARRARKEEQLGEQPVCFRCGHDGFDALLKVRAQVLEEHHVDGRNHDEDFTVIACRNCHAILHGKYTDAGVLLEVQRTPLGTLTQKLRARAELLLDLGEQFRRDAELLARLVRDREQEAKCRDDGA